LQLFQQTCAYKSNRGAMLLEDGDFRGQNRRPGNEGWTGRLRVNRLGKDCDLVTRP